MSTYLYGVMAALTVLLTLLFLSHWMDDGRSECRDAGNVVVEGECRYVWIGRTITKRCEWHCEARP